MSKVHALPIYNLHDIPEALRALANRIETGETDAVRVVVCIETSEGKSDYKAFGEEFSKAYAVGVCYAAMREILG